MAIVRTAPELNVVCRRRATRGMGRDVMELEETLLGAAAAMAAHEGAPAPVAEPDRALHFSRDVARTMCSTPALARVVRRRELLLGQVLQERRQRPIEDRRRIPVRDLVT